MTRWIRGIFSWRAPLGGKGTPGNGPPPISRELWERALALVRTAARPCWVPDCAEEDGSSLNSKFGGTPWLAPDETWPACGYCAEPLRFFVQLNSVELPPESGEVFRGLLQLWYCTSRECAPDAEGFGAFGRLQLARLVPSPAAPTAKPNPGSDPFPARRIIGWTRREDIPDEGEASLA